MDTFSLMAQKISTGVARKVLLLENTKPPHNVRPNLTILSRAMFSMPFFCHRQP